MYEQINDQIMNFSRTAVDAVVKANAAAAKGFEQIVGIQLGAAEATWNETAAFLSEAGNVREANAAKEVLPKGIALAKANFERAYGTARELVDVTVKTGEELSAVARTGFEAINADVAATAKKSKAAK